MFLLFLNYGKKYLFKLCVKLCVSQAFELVVDFMKLEIFFEKVFHIFCFNDPWGNWFFSFLFFLNHDFRSIDLFLLKLVDFDSFVDFGFGLLFFLEIFLDIDKGVVSLFFIIVNFGDFFDLMLKKGLLGAVLLIFLFTSCRPSGFSISFCVYLWRKSFNFL